MRWRNEARRALGRGEQSARLMRREPLFGKESQGQGVEIAPAPADETARLAIGAPHQTFGRRAIVYSKQLRVGPGNPEGDVEIAGCAHGGPLEEFVLGCATGEGHHEELLQIAALEDARFAFESIQRAAGDLTAAERKSRASKFEDAARLGVEECQGVARLVNRDAQLLRRQRLPPFLSFANRIVDRC